MTTKELTDYVWQQLGPRKHLAGRGRISKIVEQYVRTWPSEVLGQCRDDAEREMVAQASIGSVRRQIREHQYGMIWTLLLSALASAVFQALLKWWLERRTNRVMMLVMRQEAKR